MTIHELVLVTRKDIKLIKREHRVVAKFQRENPWLIANVLNDIKLQRELERIPAPVPTFDSLLELKETLLVDTMGKVYKQVMQTKGEDAPIHFYKVMPRFYEQQQAKGYELGDVDELGYMVTGSNLVIESSSVNRAQFLTHYYGSYN